MRTWVWPWLVGILVAVLVGCGGSGSSSGTAASSSTACALDLTITETSGTVWGTVNVKDGSTSKRISSASKSMSLPCGSTATLTEKPTNATTWPFHRWTVQGKTKSGSRIRIPISGTTKVKAVYTLPSSSGKGSGSVGGY